MYEKKEKKRNPYIGNNQCFLPCTYYLCVV